MKLLINFDKTKEYLDIQKHEIHLFDTLQPTIGLYKKLNSGLSAIYVEDNKLFILWNGWNYEVTDSCNVKFENEEKPNQKTFQYYDVNTLLFKFTYEIKISVSNISPFEYIDEDDSDWGMFVANIINDKKRKEAFISQKNKKD
jgi:hypothetical protein